MRPQRMAKMQQKFEQRFAAADLNRDGKLSRTEASEKMPRLQQRFAWLDDNRDGFLSRSELQPAPFRR
jgi:Ca2+-binding EF-hand superfamily protein